MTEQEVIAFIKALEIKQVSNQKMTVSELTILDIYKGLQKEGNEITAETIAETIEQVLFMMD